MAQPLTNALGEAPPPRMTYEEFLKWVDEDTRAEWVNGEAVPISPVSSQHLELSGFLFILIAAFVETHHLGKVFYERFQMKLASIPSGREPDILFVAQENLWRLTSYFLDGPADLAVEIIDSESDKRDRSAKFYEYEKGGVREYWLLDIEHKQAAFYPLGTDGIFRAVSPDTDGIYRSLILNGLWLKVDWLWQNPRPAYLDVLKEWGIV